jgi:hypothetical protein
MAETILKPITDATPFIPGQQTQPTVTALTDGRFVAVWSEFRSTTSFDEIYARVLNADGSFAGPAFQVNIRATNTQWEPDVAALPDGQFLIVYNDYSWGQAIGRIMNPDGTGGDPFVIDQDGINDAQSVVYSQADPSVSVFPDGSFVVAWANILSGKPNGTSSCAGSMRTAHRSATKSSSIRRPRATRCCPR